MNGMLSRSIVLEYKSSTQTWEQCVIDLLDPNATLPEVCYIFLESGDWYKKYCSEANRKTILAPFQVPDFLSNETCIDLNGYFGSRSSFSTEGGDSKLQGLSTWFKILTKKVLTPEDKILDSDKDYLWFEMSFFTRWKSANASRVLCIGAPREMSTKLRTTLIAPTSPSLNLENPFVMLIPLLDEVVKLCDDCTWRITRLVRSIELHRRERPDFERLRNLARHTGHIAEVEQVTIETMEQLLDRQESTLQNVDNLSETYKVQVKEYLLFQLQIMKALRWRAQSTHDRLGEEISLAYNMLASSDNAVMKSITLLTMIFLPATFISALFSTTFFSFAKDGWQISQKFWIYWVVVIPLTVVVLCSWWWWLGGSNEAIREKWLYKRNR